MGDLEWTTPPGILLPQDEARDVVKRFHQIYRIPVLGRPSHIPTWSVFPPGFTANTDIFSEQKFSELDELFFYIEVQSTQIQLYRAKPYQVQQFFAERQPWQDKDYYILPANLTWCIAVTHNDDVIVVGEFII